MTAFEKFWSEHPANADADGAEKALAQAAWDSALCAVQAEQFETRGGQMRSAQEISATVSRLHSWNDTPA